VVPWVKHGEHGSHLSVETRVLGFSRFGNHPSGHHPGTGLRLGPRSRLVQEGGQGGCREKTHGTRFCDFGAETRVPVSAVRQPSGHHPRPRGQAGEPRLGTRKVGWARRVARVVAGRTHRARITDVGGDLHHRRFWASTTKHGFHRSVGGPATCSGLGVGWFPGLPRNTGTTRNTRITCFGFPSHTTSSTATITK